MERNRERYRLPALGAEGVRQLPRRTAGYRHLPSGESRVSGTHRLDQGRERPHGRLPRHPGRHRQPHDDGERSRRARLGRRRHRSGGGHARPAYLHADPRRGGLPAHRRELGEGHHPPRTLVLRVVEMLRGHGVVGKFVEFFGDGLDHLPLADRATIANMAPEYGATCGFFPVDAENGALSRTLRAPGRDGGAGGSLCQGPGQCGGMQAWKRCTPATLELQLGTIRPSLAGPKRPPGSRRTLRHGARIRRCA